MFNFLSFPLSLCACITICSLCVYCCASDLVYKYHPHVQQSLRLFWYCLRYWPLPLQYSLVTSDRGLAIHVTFYTLGWPTACKTSFPLVATFFSWVTGSVRATTIHTWQWVVGTFSATIISESSNEEEVEDLPLTTTSWQTQLASP